MGGFEVFAPRDRNATFQPQIVEKRQHKISSDIDRQILSLYARGLSYSDIQQHIAEIYGLEVSDGVIGAITQRIIPEIKEWQSRPLESLYPVIWLDAMHFKVRIEGVVRTRAVYSILGVTSDGEKEVLGLYFGENESASFWKNVLYDLKERGIKDIFIACIDNLKGFADAIEDMYPHTDVQLCLVHQMRNSMKYLPDKDIRAVVKDLKSIYKAIDQQEGYQKLLETEEKWKSKYKLIFKSWHQNWARLSNFYKYPPALRRLIYTTNPVESFHRMVRKVTKTKGAFTSEDAIVKQIYLATINAQTKWKGAIFGWPSIRKDLHEFFNERFIDTLY
jgi:transposase-like protein